MIDKKTLTKIVNELEEIELNIQNKINEINEEIYIYNINENKDKLNELNYYKSGIVHAEDIVRSYLFYGNNVFNEEK